MFYIVRNYSTFEEIDGNPDANASIKEFGIPSYQEGITKISDDFRCVRISLFGNHPEIKTLSSIFFQYKIYLFYLLNYHHQ